MKAPPKITIGAVILLFAASFCQPAAAPAKMIFRMNHQFPATATGSKIDQWFADEISRATRGEVEIRIFWDNGLGGPRENLVLLENGDIDMAAMSAGYFPRELALHAAPNSIPMGMDDICQPSAIMKTLLSEIPSFAAEAEQHGVRALFFHLLNPYFLITKEPVVRLSDLQGKRIRTWGEEMPRMIKAAGARPVNLFLPDIYEALTQGVIDGCPFSVDLVVSYGVYPVARHITEVVLWEGPGWGVWISRVAWERLTDPQRRIFLDTAESARQREIPHTRTAPMRLPAWGGFFTGYPNPVLSHLSTLKPSMRQIALRRPSSASR